MPLIMETGQDAKDVVRAAALILIDAALNLLQEDGHSAEIQVVRLCGQRQQQLNLLPDPG